MPPHPHSHPSIFSAITGIVGFWCNVSHGPYGPFYENLTNTYYRFWPTVGLFNDTVCNLSWVYSVFPPPDFQEFEVRGSMPSGPVNVKQS